ncbi:MAG TPA: glycerophosphodiester phosphodiesterase family protein [Devosia sp.]|jgi:glycerophosphoryl diester phosphodiesterase|nr:glycerophosphodiester phosphodiesterase family protein [Devosia sp.]
MALFDRPIAHRGLHDHARGVIENSRSAFEAALAAGYGIECDVQLASDGVPFMFHDDDFDRVTTARGRSDAQPIGVVQKLVLTGSASADVPQRFDEFLAQVGGRTQLQIELKQQANPEKTRALAAAVAASLRGYRGPYTLESFDPYLLAALRREGVRAPLGIITYGYDEPEWDSKLPAGTKFVLRHLLHWPWTRFDFISCRNVSLYLPMVRFLRARGMPVTAWTITSPQAAEAARRGADQIVFEGFLPAIG